MPQFITSSCQIGVSDSLAARRGRVPLQSVMTVPVCHLGPGSPTVVFQGLDPQQWQQQPEASEENVITTNTQCYHENANLMNYHQIKMHVNMKISTNTNTAMTSGTSKKSLSMPGLAIMAPDASPSCQSLEDVHGAINPNPATDKTDPPGSSSPIPSSGSLPYSPFQWDPKLAVQSPPSRPPPTPVKHRMRDSSIPSPLSATRIFSPAGLERFYLQAHLELRPCAPSCDRARHHQQGHPKDSFTCGRRQSLRTKVLQWRGGIDQATSPLSPCAAHLRRKRSREPLSPSHPGSRHRTSPYGTIGPLSPCRPKARPSCTSMNTDAQNQPIEKNGTRSIIPAMGNGSQSLSLLIKEAIHEKSPLGKNSPRSRKGH